VHSSARARRIRDAHLSFVNNEDELFGSYADISGSTQSGLCGLVNAKCGTYFKEELSYGGGEKEKGVLWKKVSRESVDGAE